MPGLWKHWALSLSLCLTPLTIWAQDTETGKPPAPKPDQEKPGEEKPGEEKPDQEKPGEPRKEGVTKLPGIVIDRNAGTIELSGVICRQSSSQLEVMMCTSRGKTHESLLLVDCAAEHLQMGLILLGLKPNPQVKEFGEFKALTEGPKVVLEVAWKNADGKEVRHRIEDLIYDRRRERSMERAGWVFTGSRDREVPAPPDFEKTRKVFAAKYSGNLGALYHDPDAILDTPLMEGGDDTIFVPHAERLPARMTQIVVHIRAWKDGDEKGSPDEGKGRDLPPLKAPADESEGPAGPKNGDEGPKKDGEK